MAKAEEAPAAYEVTTTHSTVIKGHEVQYREGEAIHPDDPGLAAHPELFGPLRFPHDHQALVDAPEAEQHPVDHGNVNWRLQDTWPPTKAQVVDLGYTEAEADDVVAEQQAIAEAENPTKEINVATDKDKAEPEVDAVGNPIQAEVKVGDYTYGGGEPAHTGEVDAEDAAAGEVPLNRDGEPQALPVSAEETEITEDDLKLTSGEPTIVKQGPGAKPATKSQTKPQGKSTQAKKG